jgi:nicotinamidase-related amidase
MQHSTRTLLQLAGADRAPARLRDACLVLIDMQNEYIAGPIGLPDAATATANAALLLTEASRLGSPIIHVAHRGVPGGLFDREADRGAIITAVGPIPGETVLEKRLPNAFAGTELKAMIDATERKDIVLVGFMTHMCVSSTARAALDLGFRTTIDATSCATRDLPDGHGGIISSATVHQVALAELADRFAAIATNRAALL